MAEDIKQQTVSGIIWSFVERFGSLGLQLVSNILLARLLTPDDYGCLGMLSIFLAISIALVNSGFGSALVQRKEVSDIDYSTAFYWNFFLSILLYAAFFFAAPYVARFYGIPLLCPVMRLQGVVLPINALYIVQMAQVQRNMQFKRLSIIGLFSTLCAIVVAVVMAFMGLGVWALVTQQVVAAAVSLVAFWATGGWRPVWRFSWRSFRELFSFGMFMMFSGLLTSIADNIQGLIIGRRFNAATMGYYAQANRLQEVPASSLSNTAQKVLFPVLSQSQDDKRLLQGAVRKSLRMLNFAAVPAMVMLMVVAEPLVCILLSDKWLPSVPYFRILCFVGMVVCVQRVNLTALSSVGNSRGSFLWDFANRVVTILLIVAGVPFGIYGILYGMVAGAYVSALMSVFAARRVTGYSVWAQSLDFLKILALALVAGGVAACLTLLTSHYVVLLLGQPVVFLLVFYVLANLCRMPQLPEYVSIISGYIASFRQRFTAKG